MAEVDGTIEAAIQVDDGAVFANPFAPTAGLIALLELRAGPGQAPEGAPRPGRAPAGCAPCRARGPRERGHHSPQLPPGRRAC